MISLAWFIRHRSKIFCWTMHAEKAWQLSNDVRESLGIHESEFNIDDLVTELHRLPKLLQKKMLHLLFATKLLLLTFRWKWSCTMQQLKMFFSEVCRLLALLATIPASVATAERSHSALKRLKTYLRSTMTESRLTHLLLLHVHKQETVTPARSWRNVPRVCCAQHGTSKCVWKIVIILTYEPE